MSHRLDSLDAVPFENIEQLSLRHVDAGQKVAAHLIGRRALLGRYRSQGPREIIRHAQQILREVGGRVECRFGLFTLGPLAQVFRIRKRSQHAVLEFRIFSAQCVDGLQGERQRICFLLWRRRMFPSIFGRAVACLGHFNGLDFFLFVHFIPVLLLDAPDIRTRRRNIK